RGVPSSGHRHRQARPRRAGPSPVPRPPGARRNDPEDVERQDPASAARTDARRGRAPRASGLRAVSGPLQFGYHLPIWGPAATRETLIAAARHIEALGFDSGWASDHVVIPFEIRSRYPYNATGDFPLPPTANFPEPLTALSLVAGATERVRLGTTVLVLPHRHPVLAAKILATLDHLAPG